MKTTLNILLCFVLTSCGASLITNPNREMCVQRAEAEYDETIELCVDEELTYEECNMHYNIENVFKLKQIECREG